MQQQTGNIVKINHPRSAHNGQYGEVVSRRDDGACEVKVGVIHGRSYTVDTIVIPEQHLETDEKMTTQNNKFRKNR